MAMPEDMGRDLPSGELLPARNLLDPGLFCQAVYGPEHCLGAKMPGAPAWEEPHLAQARSSIYPLRHFIGGSETNFQSELISNY